MTIHRRLRYNKLDGNACSMDYLSNRVTINSRSRVEAIVYLEYEYVGSAKKHHYLQDNERILAYAYRYNFVLTLCLLSPPFARLSFFVSLSLSFSFAPTIPATYYLMRDARRNKFIAHRRVTSNGILNMLPIDRFGLWKFKQRSNRSLTFVYCHVYSKRKGWRTWCIICFRASKTLNIIRRGNL